MKIVTVVGARPQFVKASVVSRALQVLPEVTEVVIHTGQHYDSNMSGIFFEELGIAEPCYNLAIGSASHGAQTGRMLEAIERVLLDEVPDLVLVYGDTNSTLAGALAAAKMNIQVAHVEAGLRSFDSSMPEEINRVLTDHLSKLLFAPTWWAVRNLQNEGINGTRVQMLGDVMHDALRFYSSKTEVRASSLLKELGLTSKQYMLSTLHRAENTDDPQRLRNIFRALAQVSPTLRVVFPMHPRTRKALANAGMLEEILLSVEAVPPVSYVEMMALEKNARLIATDSGGVQKEAFLHGVPCVTLRERTEWTELVDCGWNRLANPSDIDAVIGAVRESLEHTPLPVKNPYGDGHAGDRIARTIVGFPVFQDPSKCAIHADL